MRTDELKLRIKTFTENLINQYLPTGNIIETLKNTTAKYWLSQNIGKLDSILSLLEYYIPGLQNRQICLNTGVLVGELTPPINRELAKIETSRERGR